MQYRVFQRRGRAVRYFYSPGQGFAVAQRSYPSKQLYRRLWYCVRDAQGARVDGANRTAIHMHPSVYRVYPAAEQRRRWRTTGAARPGPTGLGADEQRVGRHHARAPQPRVRRYVVATRVQLGDDGVYRAVRRFVDKHRGHQRPARGGRGLLVQALRWWRW